VRVIQWCQQADFVDGFCALLFRHVFNGNFLEGIGSFCGK
jgi:hypothetical protein